MSGEILHAMFRPLRSPLFELARVLVRLDHVANVIVNVDHGIMRAAVVHRVVDRVAGRDWRLRQNGEESTARLSHECNLANYRVSSRSLWWAE